MSKLSPTSCLIYRTQPVYFKWRVVVSRARAHARALLHNKTHTLEANLYFSRRRIKQTHCYRG